MESETIEKIVETFSGRSFSTLDFVNEYKQIYDKSWARIVEKYGVGGKGAGNYYSAYTFVAQQLSKESTAGRLCKLDYRQAPEEWGNRIIRYWSKNEVLPDQSYFPDEIPDIPEILEGAKKQVVVNVYERDPKARLGCIENWGLSCFICNFNFEDFYGSRGTGYIHVHHLKPLSELGREYVVDPKADLRPLCPNCHAMVHRSKPAMDVYELKSELERAGKI